MFSHLRSLLPSIFLLVTFSSCVCCRRNVLRALPATCWTVVRPTPGLRSRESSIAVRFAAGRNSFMAGLGHSLFRRRHYQYIRHSERRGAACVVANKLPGRHLNIYKVLETRQPSP